MLLPRRRVVEGENMANLPSLDTLSRLQRLPLHQLKSADWHELHEALTALRKDPSSSLRLSPEAWELYDQQPGGSSRSGAVNTRH